MVSNEVWMGSGTSVTMAYESDLFLGYMNPGPTMGLTGTKEANYVRYNVGYEDDGSNWSATSKEFSDYYELVPDLYTGCTAEFYYTEGTGNPTLQMTAMVAGNDKTGIYFAGQKADYPSCLFNTGTASPSNPRGYIILKGRGATIPAPISMRRLTATTITADDLTDAGWSISTVENYEQDNPGSTFFGNASQQLCIDPATNAVETQGTCIENGFIGAIALKPGGAGCGACQGTCDGSNGIASLCGVGDYNCGPDPCDCPCGERQELMECYQHMGWFKFKRPGTTGT